MSVQHHKVQEPSFFGAKDSKEISIVNNSDYPVIIVLTSDPHARQLTNLNLSGGAGNAAVEFGLENKSVIAQVKTISPKSKTAMPTSSKCYVTAVRLKSNKKYSVFRSNHEMKKGDEWTVTNVTLNGEVSVQEPTFLDQFLRISSSSSNSIDTIAEDDSPPAPQSKSTSPNNRASGDPVTELIRKFQQLSKIEKAEFGRQIFSQM